MKVPVFEVTLEGAPAKAAADKPRRNAPKAKPEPAEAEEKPRRAERREKPVQDRPKRDGTKPPKREAHQPQDDIDEPGVWNGPVPGFLGVSALS